MRFCCVWFIGLGWILIWFSLVRFCCEIVGCYHYCYYYYYLTFLFWGCLGGQLVSPGAWLTDMCQERYEVREKKSSKKVLVGLSFVLDLYLYLYGLLFDTSSLFFLSHSSLCLRGCFLGMWCRDQEDWRPWGVWKAIQNERESERETKKAKETKLFPLEFFWEFFWRW